MRNDMSSSIIFFLASYLFFHRFFPFLHSWRSARFLFASTATNVCDGDDPFSYLSYHFKYIYFLLSFYHIFFFFEKYFSSEFRVQIDSSENAIAGWGCQQWNVCQQQRPTFFSSQTQWEKSESTRYFVCGARRWMVTTLDADTLTLDNPVMRCYYTSIARDLTASK